MEFSAREDVAAPIKVVFAAVSDFEGFERAALRRGADVARTDSLTVPGKGMSWATEFSYRNRRRQAKLELVQYDAPESLRLLALSRGIETDLIVDLVALSRGRTRMDITARLKPTTITARLFVQSMKLARSSLTSRYCKRIAEFAGSIEDRYSRA